MVEEKETQNEEHAAEHAEASGAGDAPYMRRSELERRLEEKAAQEAAEKSQDVQLDAEDAAQALEEIDALRTERDALKDQLLRRQAEFENYRKRTARETERIRKTASEQLVSDLLPVIDHLELALQHAGDASGGIEEGVQMVLKQFADTLQRHGLEPIAAKGEPFDPNVHEAVMQREDASVPEHTVLEEYQRGYLLGGQVLRPAKVVVSTGGPEAAASEAPDDQDGEEMEVVFDEGVGEQEEATAPEEMEAASAEPAAPEDETDDRVRVHVRRPRK